MDAWWVDFLLPDPYVLFFSSQLLDFLLVLLNLIDVDGFVQISYFREFSLSLL